MLSHRRQPQRPFPRSASQFYTRREPQKWKRKNISRAKLKIQNARGALEHFRSLSIRVFTVIKSSQLPPLMIAACASFFFLLTGGNLCLMRWAKRFFVFCLCPAWSQLRLWTVRDYSPKKKSKEKDFRGFKHRRRMFHGQSQIKQVRSFLVQLVVLELRWWKALFDGSEKRKSKSERKEKWHRNQQIKRKRRWDGEWHWSELLSVAGDLVVKLISRLHSSSHFALLFFHAVRDSSSCDEFAISPHDADDSRGWRVSFSRFLLYQFSREEREKVQRSSFQSSEHLILPLDAPFSCCLARVSGTQIVGTFALEKTGDWLVLVFPKKLAD